MDNKQASQDGSVTRRPWWRVLLTLFPLQMAAFFRPLTNPAVIFRPEGHIDIHRRALGADVANEEQDLVTHAQLKASLRVIAAGLANESVRRQTLENLIFKNQKQEEYLEEIALSAQNAIKSVDDLIDAKIQETKKTEYGKKGK